MQQTSTDVNTLRGDVLATIAQFTGQQRVLTIPRILIEFTGSLGAGLFLSQLLYWSGKTTNSDGWIFKTYAEWQDELTLSKYQVSKIAAQFEAAGWLQRTVKKAKGSPTVHYRLNRLAFEDAFVNFLDLRKLRNSTIQSVETSLSSITKSTTESTTYIYMENSMEGLPPSTTTTSQSPPPIALKSTIASNDINILRAAELEASECVLRFLDYYFKLFEAYFKRPHPVYKPELLKNCIEQLSHEGWMLDTDVVARYFETPLKCDYHLAHYCSGEVAINRYHESERAVVWTEE